VTLRFAVLGLELFTITFERPDHTPPPGRPEPTLRSKMRQAVAHSVIR
jgi:hypothetical protein